MILNTSTAVKPRDPIARSFEDSLAPVEGVRPPHSQHLQSWKDPRTWRHQGPFHSVGHPHPSSFHTVEAEVGPEGFGHRHLVEGVLDVRLAQL